MMLRNIFLLGILITCGFKAHNTYFIKETGVLIEDFISFLFAFV